ncbi:MAG: glycosyltransferase family 2 protein [Deltaproteobacteria bacterium]
MAVFADSRPQVSVLLPAFEAADTLGACLESIRRQTLRAFECIVVDDGSRDRTAAIAATYAAQDGRFRLLRRPHEGLVASLNAGTALCRSPLIARMDADDLMHSDRLRLQTDAMARDRQLALVGSHVRIFPRRRIGPGLRAYENWLNSIDSAQKIAEDAFIECPLAHPTWMLRREILQSFAYREQAWSEDYDLLLRLLLAGERINIVPRRLVCWREHDRRLTHSATNLRVESFVAAKAAFLVRGFLRDHEQYILWGYGSTGRHLRRALLPYGRQPSHIIELHPGRLGQKIHGAPVLPPAAVAELHGRPLLASVAGAGPRALVRAALAKAGFQERRDFVCVA